MSSNLIKKIHKRDGRIEKFDLNRIVNAINNAMQATGEGSIEEAKKIADIILLKLMDVAERHKKFIPEVEGVQNEVEKELMYSGYVTTAKRYILYRDQHAELRKQRLIIDDRVKKLAEKSQQYFKNNKLREFVYLRSYARWLEDEGRRETWIETVERYINFMRKKLDNILSPEEYKELQEAILNQEVMPSMRLLQFAGKAAEYTNVCAYNCAFVAPRKIRDFGEIMYVLMCGTGVGFSVESQNVQDLPKIQPQTGEVLPTHVIEDSKEGWCDALVLGMETWYTGKDIKFDYSKLRPLGARLKTMGGKSSGPGPLRELLNFTREKILNKQYRRLSSLEVHDLTCKIGEVVVSGGVRRSAMISLSDLDDVDLRDAKTGQFYNTELQRTVANNSAIYQERPDNKTLMAEWLALAHSGSGERGIFNRAGLLKTLPKRRLEFFKKKGIIKGDKIVGIIGTNPCGEIILQSKQFCNLSEVIARPKDTEETLLNKVKLATILGTYQCLLTNFPYLSDEWRRNCEEERLLGVSITGQWDSPAARDPQTLRKLKEHAININKIYAKRFNISASNSITCIKPSGTVSQMVDCSSGIHTRYAPYYIRRIRISSSDVLFKMLKDQNIPYHPEVGQTRDEATTFVFEFPIASPKEAIFRNNLSAIDQLEHWKVVKENYTEHNPSVTISVGNNEWIDVLQWIDKNWNIVGGLSFFPRADHIYQLAPYEEITKEQYEELLEKNKNIDFSQLFAYEKKDETEVKKELACAGGLCEVV